ncbi:PTS sugar transporter subunit IIB [Anaerocolumna sp. MB42-C2]|uniref:PTS sugar transporter subunit IIB n=1 Tax=Anaerocolumna sp. MB42-C2 TaxID=3070997 RepID=UPI0027E0A892|nr:PTS sugar transporter subunit IIB [Anaerocolumna sp. MB42-C2]WMJ89235.1 PTS sugar transporter subunit IIB [Anaerocolumna sp. MB42-C2]
MEHRNIILCCGGGLSSGFLAQQGRKAAKKRKLDVNIEAKSESEVTQYFGRMDILMVGPHYAFRMEAFTEQAAPYGIPVVLIPEDIYSMLDGAALLDLAIKTLEDK